MCLRLFSSPLDATLSSALQPTHTCLCPLLPPLPFACQGYSFDFEAEGTHPTFEKRQYRMHIVTLEGVRACT